ncbi:diaminopimelate epimerase [Candidatus Levibacter sp. Uisw_134_01]|uniref:diaminopimelate epimerase n=1 Tax=Candidatus Levibacter sp. Uisw_134_01 TaxID=3230999 RepID=UPI003D527E37
MKIPFIKMHGLGNDFIIFDNIKNPIIHQPDFVQQMSNRRIGVGCDQLMIIENTSIKENFKVKMYNSDGSETGACGNGVRCIADYLMKKENIDNLYIETISGKLKCNKDKRDVTVNMGRPRFEWNEIPLAKIQNTQKVFLNDFEAFCLSMGNPHAVIFLPNSLELNKLDIEKIGPILEKNSVFPQFANIEFACVLENGVIRMRVWERGVGITQACGSGACATSVAASVLGLSSKNNKIILDGGNLYIKWLEDKTVTLTGMTERVFEGILEY